MYFTGAYIDISLKYLPVIDISNEEIMISTYYAKKISELNCVRHFIPVLN